MLFRKKRDPNPEICGCGEITQVEGEGAKYWPRDRNGKRTGHHPECEHYVPPPTPERRRD